MTYDVKLVKAKNQPNKGSKFVIKGAYMMYLKHTGYGALKYNEEEVEGKPWVNYQYECDVLITKEIGETFAKRHKKLVVKVHSAKQFEDTFKIEPPFKASKYYTVKVYKEAFYKNGTKKNQEAPRVVVKDSTGKLLTDVEISNGALGNIIVSFGTFDNKWGKGTTMRLGQIQVLEYTPFESNSDDDEFEYDTSDDDEDFDTSDEDDEDNDSDEEDWDE